MSNPIKPLGNRVLVEILKSEETQIGGIFVPDSAADKPNLQGIVVAKGPNSTLVEVGAKVLIGKWAGTEVKSEDKTFQIVPEEEILAVLD